MGLTPAMLADSAFVAYNVLDRAGKVAANVFLNCDGGYSPAKVRKSRIIGFSPLCLGKTSLWLSF